MGSPAANPNFATMTMAFNAATYSAYKRLVEQNIIKKSFKKNCFVKKFTNNTIKKTLQFSISLFEII